MIKHFLNAVYGMIFGVANVIPGVSGGTMMVVFGIYDKLLDVLSFRLNKIKENIWFLIWFGIGAVLGIVGFSFVITYLFENCPIPTNMFFMGLIIGSVPLILRNATVKEKLKPVCIIPFILALALVVGLTVLNGSVSESYKVSQTNLTAGANVVRVENNSDQTMKNWSVKYMTEGEIAAVSGDAQLKDESGIINDIKTFLKGGKDNSYVFESVDGKEIAPHSAIEFTFTDSLGVAPSESFDFSYTYEMSVALFFTLLFGVAIAAVAMIIPGVSGSFVMIVLGIYTTVIGAIKNMEILILIPVAIGVIVGVILGAKMISALMKRFSLLVYSAILGLVAGSLYAIYPVGFGLNAQTLIGIVVFVVGAGVSLLVGKHTKVEIPDENSDVN